MLSVMSGVVILMVSIVSFFVLALFPKTVIGIIDIIFSVHRCNKKYFA